jgi:hypothetical protein
MPSTVIDHFVYHQKSKMLVITFISGNIYAYEKVPPGIYDNMKTARSKGSYFNEFIKDKFEFKKLTDED